MAFVRIEQRNAHLAGPVRLEQVHGKDGPMPKATLVAISNTRGRTEGGERAEEVTVIPWVVWGRQAERAAQYLGKGSHLNLVGHVRNDNFTAVDGKAVHAFAFVCDELDFLDSRGQAQARRERQEFVAAMDAAEQAATPANRATR